MSGILDGLNDPQKQAVMAESHVLVIAGPGTGKTTTIVRRIARLVEQGVPPEEILAITFTNRAAREMRERIHAVLEDRAGRMFIGTFHLLGLRIMREALREDFTICGRDEQVELLKMIVGTARAAREAVEKISRVKSGAEQLDDEARGMYEAYNRLLLSKGMYDFDDLIHIPLKMFEKIIDVPCPYGFTHIVVDEYQDVNPVQCHLLRTLARTTDAAVCAVGDSDQAIYAFRGADLENFLHFENDYPGAEVVVLEENYRSTGMIATAANGLIKRNERRIDKAIRHRRELGRPVTIITVPDERMEAEAIVRAIECRMGGTSHFRLMGAKASTDFSGTSASFSDFAVFFRTNAQAKMLREAFTEWGIPCQVVGEKHSTATRVVINALRSYLECGIPERASLAEVLEMAAEGTHLGEYEQQLLLYLTLAWRDLPLRNGLVAIVDELSLFAEADVFDPRADAVALMTLHAAKGLEFKVAFIAGVEEGLLPFTLVMDAADIEEERRLFFVGMTRAMEELFLLHATSRFVYGERRGLPPSRFLSEIPSELIRTEVMSGKGKGHKQAKQMGLF